MLATLPMQVGNFENHYHFQLLLNTTTTNTGAAYTKSADYRHIRDRMIGSLAEIGLQSAVTSRLQSETTVYCIYHA